MVKTGASVALQFLVSDANGALSNADALPTGTLVKNGTATADVVTVSNISTGVYSASVTMPTLAAGDVMQIRIAATIGGVTTGGVVWRDDADTKYVSDTLSANVTQLNGTAQTAGDIIPAISGIGTAGGAAINTDAATDNSAGGIPGVTSATTKIGTFTGTFSNTSVLDGTAHLLTGTATNFDVVYQFLTGGGTSPIAVVWTGYVQSANDSANFQAWNHVGGAWETIGSIVGANGANNVVKNLVLYARHAGTSAAELGKIYIRIVSATGTSPVLSTDQIYVTYAVTSRSVGYAEGAVWLDTVNGVAGTESYVNGTADKPANTLANALTIATAVGVRRIRVINGSTVTLVSTITNYTFAGKNWTLALGGQAVSGCYFEGATVSGTCSGTRPRFADCEFGAATSVPPAEFHHCEFQGTITYNAAGDYDTIDCASTVAGTSTPIFAIPAGTVTCSFRRWSGGIKITGITSGTTVSIDIVSGGGVTLEGANGNVQVRGMIASLTDSRTGSPTLGNNALINQTAITDQILDRTDGIETGLTVREGLRLSLAALAGKLSGGGTNTIVIRNPGDTKNRITATVDGNNNRLVVTYDLT